MKASIVDLRYHMKDVLRALDRGETVTVLHRGKERARLTPISQPLPRNGPDATELPFFGMWKDREDLADPVSYVRELRRDRTFSAEPKSGRKTARKRRK